jgi:hypothetical protein
LDVQIKPGYASFIPLKFKDSTNGDWTHHVKRD